MTGIYSREFGNGKKPAGLTRKLKPSRANSDRTQEAREKQSRAVELRKAGASFTEIAQALNYHDASGAKKAVEAAIRRFEFETTADVLKMDLARLDEYLKLATHRMRTAGDLNQIDRCMRILERKHYLLGVTPATLAETQDDGTSKTQGGMNVVIAATERDFVRGMMIAVGVDPDSPEAEQYLQNKAAPEAGGRTSVEVLPRALPSGAQPGTNKAGKKRLKKRPTTTPPKAGGTDLEGVLEGEIVGVVPESVLATTTSAEVAAADEVLTPHEESRRLALARSVKRRDEDDIIAGVTMLSVERI